ncbi:MAG: type II secretion system protein [Candidatus Gracilibacteria bacterium]|nr:type II secretion system protein [Candidatus Gracilibacteria bacterium]
MHKRGGFTLVELMIVIAIIGVLALLLPSISHMYFERAKQTQTKVAILNLQNIIEEARINTDKVLGQITGSYCTEYKCKPPPRGDLTGPLVNIPETNECYTSWKSAVDKIFFYAGHDSAEAEKYYRDPWNAPYLLDENEGEFATACDRIMSSFGNAFSGLYLYKFSRLDGVICP